MTRIYSLPDTAFLPSFKYHCLPSISGSFTMISSCAISYSLALESLPSFINKWVQLFPSPSLHLSWPLLYSWLSFSWVFEEVFILSTMWSQEATDCKAASEEILFEYLLMSYFWAPLACNGEILTHSVGCTIPISSPFTNQTTRESQK